MSKDTTNTEEQKYRISLVAITKVPFPHSNNDLCLKIRVLCTQEQANSCPKLEVKCVIIISNTLQPPKLMFKTFDFDLNNNNGSYCYTYDFDLSNDNIQLDGASLDFFFNPIFYFDRGVQEIIFEPVGPHLTSRVQTGRITLHDIVFPSSSIDSNCES